MRPTAAEHSIFRASIVGSSASQRDRVARWFRAAGWNVGTGASLREDEVQRAIDEGPVLLVLLLESDADWEEQKSIAAISRSETITLILVVSQDRRGNVAALLEAGADDVISGAIDRDELLARAHALVRRISRIRKATASGESGLVAIDETRHTVTIGGVQVALTCAEFELFAYFARRLGEIVAPSEIIERVFGTRHTPDTALVRVHILWLRRKLVGKGVEILTVRGRGYRLTLDDRHRVTFEAPKKIEPSDSCDDRK